MKLTIALFSLACITAFAADETVRVTSRFCGDPATGTGYFFEIPVSRARALPEWNADSGTAPPISISGACDAAKKALQARYSTNAEFEVSEIELHPLPSFGTWFYDIECQTTKYDRQWSPCGMRAVILMDGSNVEPRVVGGNSDLGEAMQQADRVSFDVEQQFARARMGDTNALAALFAFSPNVDAAKSPGFGKILIDLLRELGDAAFAKILAMQSSVVKSAVRSHLDAGVANTKGIGHQSPIAESFPLTYAALTSQ